MAQPSKIKAMVIKAKGQATVTTVPLPHLRDDYILVKTTAIALNPTDWKNIDFASGGNPTGARVGCDYAGIVQEVGSRVTKSFARGDRICGVVHGSTMLVILGFRKQEPDVVNETSRNLTQKEDGAFAEYIVVKGDVQLRIPNDMSDAEAATLGVGITTVGQGLYQSLKLPLPGEAPKGDPTPFLIYGGSTATGALGIQFAKLSNCQVVTTCSAKNFSYVASLGADAYFDYHGGDAAEQIRTYTGGCLQHAWDCISTAQSARVCAAALADDCPVKYRALLEVSNSVLQSVNPGVDNGFTSSYTVFGEGFEKAVWVEGRPKDFEFAKMFFNMCEGLLEQGLIKPVRPTVNLGGKGLVGAIKGLKHLKEGRVSATKLVYTML
ncbi:Zinc-binding oxidoreductase [Pyrenophora tritici-repentis]|nr:Zinc-binding oxidoreductase [Pyrenophora tritici-repentis]